MAGFRILTIFIATASIVAAAAAKSELQGFNGVAFGTKFSAAKKQLGGGAKADHDPADAKLKILLAHAALYGENFTVNYSFDHAEKFIAAYAIATLPTGDYAVCKSRWDKVRGGVVGAFGAPAEDEDQMNATVQSETLTYTFESGNRVEASILGCLITVNFLSRDAE